MTSERKQRWAELGYTEEQVECHLNWERRKSKEARERKKKNNEKNTEIIKQIKDDLLGKTFELSNGKIKILKISETNDGKGFWYKLHKTFRDGSNGEFRYFYRFDEYNFKEFLEDLRY